MKIAIFSTKSYDRTFLEAANSAHGHDLVFYEPRLTPETVTLAEGFPAICIFVNDHLNSAMLQTLAQNGTRLIALRSAGFNHVDLQTAQHLNITVVRVPAYSPYAVAEHTVALLLALNRKIHRAYARVREGNFALDGLLGFDIHGQTVGIVGTGKIGVEVARILHGFGCKLLAYDITPNEACEKMDVRYMSCSKLFEVSNPLPRSSSAWRYKHISSGLEQIEPSAELDSNQVAWARAPPGGRGRSSWYGE